MIDADTKFKIVELRSKDTSIAKIADKLKIAKQTVVDVCKEMTDEIATLRAIQLDALYEEQALTAEARIKRLSSLLAKIQAELDARTLEDVPTDKLMDLLMKTESQLAEARVEPIFKSSQEKEEEREARESLRSLI